MKAVFSIHEILQQLDQPFTGESLFDHLPDIVFFIKNSLGQYVVVNRTLVERCGVRDKSQLLGRTAAEVLRPPLGERFEAQDRKVLQTARPLLEQLKLHIHPSHDIGWCLTSKLPLLNKEGMAIGLVGVSQDLRPPDSSGEGYRYLLAAVSYAKKNLHNPPSIEELARIAGMSRFQLDRRMRHVFGLTTGQWLLKLRIDSAQQRLTETSDSIATIAQQAGYGDQSAFTRQFHQATGLSPREYRKARNAEIS